MNCARWFVRSGAEILDGPGEFPFGPGGYYAFYFLGPDRLNSRSLTHAAGGAELPSK